MTTKLYLGHDDTCLELPVIPNIERHAPAFRTPEPRERRSDVRHLGSAPWPQGFYEWKRDLWTTKTSVEWKGYGDSEISGSRYHSWERNYYETNDEKPAESKFSGEAGHRIDREGRTIEFKTILEVQSDAQNFFVSVTRFITENGKLLRQREWKETIPRMFN
jgi:hypothetical protein